MSIPWWQRGAIYQIYPRSFADSDGDGVGDLRGIIDRLDYLADLKISAVWLSPFYRSPMADFGYDVADHRDVDPLFGTVEDFDALAAEARRLDLKLILAPRPATSAPPRRSCSPCAARRPSTTATRSACATSRSR